MAFAERVKQSRKQKGLTQLELANKIGVSKSTVALWETGKRFPSYDTLLAVARELDIQVLQEDMMSSEMSSDSGDAVTMVDAKTDDALFQVEQDLTEYALKYARLDQYGRDAVEAVIRAEYNRCRGENTLCPAEAYAGEIKISREAISTD